jgi:hypothetical protein
MKTLILHIGDSSKDFLKSIYQEMPQKTVISEFISREDLITEIENHDAVIIMGNGGSDGIWGLKLMDDNLIDSTFLNQLKLKKSLIFIWFNAHKFLTENHFQHQNTLCTGKFISEPLEAIFLDNAIQNPEIEDYEQMIEASNFAFADILGSLLNEYGFQNLKFIHSELKRQYFNIAHQNEVAAYNFERLYCNLID